MAIFTMTQSFIAMKLNKIRSRKYILKLQNKKFRKILKHAYNHSKFYRDLYSSHNISDKDLETIDIEKLPIVTKELLMKNLDDVLTVSDVTKKELLEFLDESIDPFVLFKDKYHVIHTSGSSGQLGIFVYNKREWSKFFPYLTELFKFNFGTRKSVFYGAAGGHFTGASTSAWTGKGLSGIFSKSLVINITDPLDDVIQKLNKFQPDILGGYFNGLKVLAEQQRKGNLKINPEVLVNCGEGINLKLKENIEKTFKAPMSNLYGFAESPIVAVGTEEVDGLYLRDDISIIELKEDHLLLTNLYNKTEPVIRYRINDYVKLKKKADANFPFDIIDTIVGREEFVIWFENKDGNMDFIHPLIFTDFYVNGLEKLQIVIKSKTSFEFLAIINSKNKKMVTELITKKLDKILNEKNFSNVSYKIIEVDDLKVDKRTGKFRLIIDKTKQK